MTETAAPSPSSVTQRAALWPWLTWAVVSIVLDQASKWWVLATYQLGEGTRITDFFNLARAHNYGAAFSFLAGAGGWQRWFFTLFAVAVSSGILWMMHRHRSDRLFCFGLASILGGAIGNVIDRVWHGYVVDFLDFHWAGSHFPTFNLADSAITLGVICLLWQEVQRMRQEKKTT